MDKVFEYGKKILDENPDIVKNKGKNLNISQLERIELLVKTVKEELVKDYDKFIVKIIQIYFYFHSIKKRMLLFLQLHFCHKTLFRSAS